MTSYPHHKHEEKRRLPQEDTRILPIVPISISISILVPQKCIRVQVEPNPGVTQR
jgi:hypothetical protein